MLKRLLYIFIIALGLILAGCGFHLRTPQKLAEPLYVMYLATTNPNDPFIQTLKRTLAANGVNVVTQPKLAQSILTITALTNSNNLIQNGGVAISGTYTAYLSVTFTVSDTAHHVLLPDTTLTQSQNFNTNATQILSASNTAAQLTDTMQQDLANQLLTYLTKISAHEIH